MISQSDIITPNIHVDIQAGVHALVVAVIVMIGDTYRQDHMMILTSRLLAR